LLPHEHGLFSLSHFVHITVRIIFHIRFGRHANHIVRQRYVLIVILPVLVLPFLFGHSWQGYIHSKSSILARKEFWSQGRVVCSKLQRQGEPANYRECGPRQFRVDCQAIPLNFRSQQIFEVLLRADRNRGEYCILG
jgi:hypothetical protein